MLPEFLTPGPDDRWDPVIPPGGTFNGEYVWRRTYPAAGTELDRLRVTGGAFLDEPVHIRLVSYSQLGDLRTENQLWPDDSPAAGNRVWRPDETQPGTFIPEDRAGRISRRPWVYMGPGIWFNQDAGERQVHIRLAPTTNNIPGWEDYEPDETDPNNVRLALCREQDYAIFLMDCQHITFRDLTLRFGNPDTIRLNTCTDIMFDHCRIRSGNRALNLLTGNAPEERNQDIRVEHCVVDGGIPTWFFRSDRKDEYLMGPTDKDRAVKEETVRNRLGASTSGVQISGTKRNFGVTVHHCEIFNAHDSYVFGDGMVFHHNWVHNLNDDGIALSGEAETTNAKIFCNVMTQCLTALSFASEKTLGPVYLYGNLIDIRRPTLGIRPKQDSGAADSLRQGHFFKDGADEGQIELFHNTCVVLDPGAKGDDLDDLTRAGFSYYVTIGENSEPRRAFNNIMVAVYSSAAEIRPIAFLAPPRSKPSRTGTRSSGSPRATKGLSTSGFCAVSTGRSPKAARTPPWATTATTNGLLTERAVTRRIAPSGTRCSERSTLPPAGLGTVTTCAFTARARPRATWPPCRMSCGTCTSMPQVRNPSTGAVTRPVAHASRSASTDAGSSRACGRASATAPTPTTFHLPSAADE